MSEMALDASDSTTRTLTMQVRCNPELGLSGWDGKRARIIVHDVMEMQFSFHGCQMGLEEFNSWDRVETTPDEKTKFGRGALKCGICFHSGSELDIICAGVTVHRVD